MKKQLLLSTFILLSPISSMAATIFTDDFTDGDTNGWVFYGNNSSAWSGASGTLNHNAPAGYNGTPEFALIDGITTPDQFILEADVSVISSINGSDNGHVGFAWGINDLTEPFESFNTSYLRTHTDLVTNWSTLSGSFLGEQFLNTSSLTNGATYHLSVEVDYLARTMITSIEGNTTTFSGVNFDNINQNSGGGIGLISWNDNITFDNVTLSTPSSVPEPAAAWLCASGLISLIGARKKSVKLSEKHA